MDTDLRNDPAVPPDLHRTDLVALLFTDIVGSTSLKHELGDRAGTSLIQRHHVVVRETLAGFPAGKEVETAGDSFLIAFTTPSAAVEFALLLQARVRGFSPGGGVELQDRIGIHRGEVVVQEHAQGLKPRDFYGIQVDICARVMSMAQGGQILLTRSVFDSARQMLKGGDIPGVGQLSWLNHGSYELKGLQEPIEICEVGEVGQGRWTAPVTSEKAHRHAVEGVEPVLGWRPAVEQAIPNTRWVLEKKLGEGGFGEVWLGRNSTTKQARVFKFCFQVERVRFLKREMTLFRVLNEQVGDHPKIVRLNDVYLDQPPFCVEMMGSVRFTKLEGDPVKGIIWPCAPGIIARKPSIEFSGDMSPTRKSGTHRARAFPVQEFTARPMNRPLRAPNESSPRISWSKPSFDPRLNDSASE